MEEWLQSQEFYDLLQMYRHTSELDQENVIRRFEMIKDALIDKANEEFQRGIINALMLPKK